MCDCVCEYEGAMCALPYKGGDRQKDTQDLAGDGVARHGHPHRQTNQPVCVHAHESAIECEIERVRVLVCDCELTSCKGRP